MRIRLSEDWWAVVLGGLLMILVRVGWLKWVTW